MAIRDLIWNGTAFDTIEADTLDNIDSSSFLLKSGGTMTGSTTMSNANIHFNTTGTGLVWSMNTDGAGIRFNNTGDQDANSCLEFYTLDNGTEFFKWSHTSSGSASTEWMSLKSDGLRIKGNLVYHAGNKPTPEAIGAATSGHTHNYVASGGGTYNAGFSLGRVTLTDYGTPFECSQYIDFHAVGSNVDYSVRLTGTSGLLTCSGDFSASRVLNAVWNDYAELFEKEELDLTAGDILAWNNTGVVKATVETKNTVVGVYSDTYGHLLGGDEGKSEKENLEKYAPIGLSGRVYVKVKGLVEKGDFIVPSNIPGVGRATKEYIPGTVVGKALEAYNSNEVKRIQMFIMNI